MIVKGRENRDQLEVFSIEEFVPAEHLLRKTGRAIYTVQITAEYIRNTTEYAALYDRRKETIEWVFEAQKENTQRDIPHTEAYPK